MSRLLSVLFRRDLKRTLLLGVMALGLLAATSAQAIMISFQPTTQTRQLGQTASVDVVVSGLSAAGQVVSAYDLDVLFDTSILSFSGATPGTSLGGPGDSFFNVFFTIELGNVGRIDFYENSLFTTDAPLLALQGDSVVLATLNFVGIGLGTSPLVFDQNWIVNGLQVPNSNPPEASVLNVNAQQGSITIESNGNVPEPGTFALLALGLAGLVGLRRKTS